MNSPGRPKEHRERHLATPDDAAARFLELHPELQFVVDFARATPLLTDFLAYLASFAAWKQRYDFLLGQMEVAPKIPTSILEAASTPWGGAIQTAIQGFRNATSASEALMRDREGYLAVPSLSITGLPEFSDRQFMMAVASAWLALEVGTSLDPLDIVLLHVASRVADPTTDEGEYGRRSDNWRKRMARVRVWAEMLRQGFTRKAPPENAGPSSGGTPTSGGPE